ncbi:Subtilisin-like protease SBT1.4 [Bienertia sinuspersici]
MATPSLPFSFIFFFLTLFTCSTPTLSKKSTYIIHVSHSHKPATFASAHEWYSSILHSLTSNSNTSTKSKPNILYTYSHSATGFAARISTTHANKLRRLPFVLSVVPDQMVELTTTHTPGFLGLTDKSGLWPRTSYGSDIIIGVVDSGIWPESVSFHDQGFSDVPANWRGFCEVGPDFPASSCNKKIIGARFFYEGYETKVGRMNETKSARDENGHGTHCASTAGGSAVRNAGYHRYAFGEARGVALMARIAVYKVFWGKSARGTIADAIAAIGQAIEDGVHVLSLSISTSGSNSDYYNDQLAIASFRAMQKGILVLASAGNTGRQGSFTVKNISPWMLTVAASSIDRQFSAQILLGDGRVIKGSTLSDFRKLKNNSTSYSLLITGQAAGSTFCIAAGGIGMVLVDRARLVENLEPLPFVIPGITVTHTDGNHIKSYINSTTYPVASIVFKGTIIGPATPSAPRLAPFSSRGPNKITPEILTAPGVNILAAWTGASGPTALDIDTRRVGYNILSGTSMSCPHVSGLGALLRKAHPSWSSASIKSAIMTTSYNHDNAGNNLIDLSTGRQSSPFVHGSGHIDPEKAVDPGLVYDLDTNDYVAFLCSIGYNSTTIEQFVQDPSMINCRANNLSSPGDLNYPSFSVVFKSLKDTITYTRVLKNVGSSVRAVYQVRVSAPENVRVDVFPTLLLFSEYQQTLSYNISFTSVDKVQTPTSNGLSISFGSIEWTDGSHHVRSPITAYWPNKQGVQEDLVATI